MQKPTLGYQTKQKKAQKFVKLTNKNSKAEKSKTETVFPKWNVKIWRFHQMKCQSLTFKTKRQNLTFHFGNIRSVRDVMIKSKTKYLFKNKAATKKSKQVFYAFWKVTQVSVLLNLWFVSRGGDHLFRFRPSFICHLSELTSSLSKFTPQFTSRTTPLRNP